MKYQEYIAKFLSVFDIKIENNTNIKSNMNDLFLTILNKLMTGKIRVKDIEFEIEKSLEEITA